MKRIPIYAILTACLIAVFCIISKVGWGASIPEPPPYDLVYNGSFEETEGFEAISWNMCSIWGWRITDGGGPMPDGRIAAYCDPDNSVEGPTWMHNDAWMQPDVPYHLSFWARWYYHYGDSFGVVIGLGPPQPEAPGPVYTWHTWTFWLEPDGQWRQYELPILLLEDTQLWIGAVGSGDDACMLDLVSVEPVPELSSLAALCGLLGCCIIRRASGRTQ